MRTIAILCGGGPAPGINTVVATVTKVFLKDGFRVLAIHEGYKGLFAVHPEVEELTYEKADQIYSRGGSAIKMSRFKPEDQDFTTALFVKEGIELLVTIGGDDTASTANRLTKYLAAHQVNIRNIHVPKTKDNDLPLPEGIPTFGLTSAKEMGVTIGKVIKAEASTTQNWYLLMSMGREAGHLAFEIEAGRVLQKAVPAAAGENIRIDKGSGVEHGAGFLKGPAAAERDQIGGAWSGAQKDDGSHERSSFFSAPPRGAAGVMLPGSGAR